MHTRTVQHRLLAVFAALFLLFGLSVAAVAAPTQAWAALALEGAGTEADPYLIGNEDDLIAFQQAINADTHAAYGTDNAAYTGKYFKLTADIELTKPWVPIGKSTTIYFAGHFDGDGHTVSNVTYSASGSSAAYLGFFGRVQAPTGVNVSIKNLKIAGAGTDAIDLNDGTTSASSYVGGIAAYVNPSTTTAAGATPAYVTIDNCVSDINIKGGRYVGGIAGYANTNVNITNCLVLGDIAMVNKSSSIAASYAGGILGTYNTSSNNPTFANNLFLGQINATPETATATGSFANTVNALVGKVYSNTEGGGMTNFSNNHYADQDDAAVKAYRSGNSTAIAAIDPTEGMVVDEPTSVDEWAALVQTLGWAENSLVAQNLPYAESDEAAPSIAFTTDLDEDVESKAINEDATARTVEAKSTPEATISYQWQKQIPASMFDSSELQKALQALNILADSVKVSTDGTDVSMGDYWITQALADEVSELQGYAYEALSARVAQDEPNDLAEACTALFDKIQANKKAGTNTDLEGSNAPEPQRYEAKRIELDGQWQDIEGATSASYTPDTSAVAFTTYRCVASATIDGTEYKAESKTTSERVLLSSDKAYAITKIDTENGSITVEATAPAGKKVDVSATPAEGYKVASIKVVGKDGTVLAYNESGEDKIIFTMPWQDVEVSATFKQEIKYVAVSFDPGSGTFSGDATVTVVEGSTVGKPADPTGTDACHPFKEWQLDGAPYDFGTEVTSDITLVAAYSESHTWRVTYTDEDFCEVCGTYNPDATTYHIDDAKYLAEIARAVNAGDNLVGKTVVLEGDIDLAAYDNWSPIGGASTQVALNLTTEEQFNQALEEHFLIYDNVGNSYVRNSEKNGAFDPSRSFYYLQGAPFAGEFDGASKTVANLNVSSANSYLGLFGNVTGTIKNVTVEGSVTSTASNDFTGGIVGKLSADGTIEGCTNKATVTANRGFNVGGVVGFVGEMGKLVSDDNPIATVRACANYGEVHGNTRTGGIAGRNAGLVEQCANHGDVWNESSAKKGTGGIVGMNGVNNAAEDAGIIRDCYNEGFVHSKGGYWCGGIAGFQNAKSTTDNCYNAGLLQAGPSATSYYSWINPIVGQDEGAVSNCLWLNTNTGDNTANYVGRDTTGVGVAGTAPANVKGVNANELKALSSVMLLNSDGKGAWQVDCDDYPALIWEDAAAHALSKVDAVAATCEEDGTAEHWKCSVCGKLFSDAEGTTEIDEPATLPATGHDWGEPTYTWADDNSTVTAKRICAHDAEHVETETAAATSEVTTAPGCETEGVRTWTSAAFENGAFEVQTKDVAEPAAGHDWDEGVVTVQPTETEEGVRTYTCKHDASHTYTEAIPALGPLSVVDGPRQMWVAGEPAEISALAENLAEGETVVKWYWEYTKTPEDDSSWKRSGAKTFADVAECSMAIPECTNARKAPMTWRATATTSLGRTATSAGQTLEELAELAVVPAGEFSWVEGQPVDIKANVVGLASGEEVASYQWYYSKDNATFKKTGAACEQDGAELTIKIPSCTEARKAPMAWSVRITTTTGRTATSEGISLVG